MSVYVVYLFYWFLELFQVNWNQTLNFISPTGFGKKYFVPFFVVLCRYFSYSFVEMIEYEKRNVSYQKRKGKEKEKEKRKRNNWIWENWILYLLASTSCMDIDVQLHILRKRMMVCKWPWIVVIFGMNWKTEILVWLAHVFPKEEVKNCLVAPVNYIFKLEGYWFKSCRGKQFFYQWD